MVICLNVQGVRYHKLAILCETQKHVAEKLRPLISQSEHLHVWPIEKLYRRLLKNIHNITAHYSVIYFKWFYSILNNISLVQQCPVEE